MTWSKHPGAQERRGYHHGNLREALVDAALALIAENGAGRFAMTDAARRAGVSPGAPYRHFRDGEALLSEVARRGFDLLADALTAAWRDARPDVAFAALGHAYLGFARTESAYYAAMFDSRIELDADPALQAAADRAFGVLRAAAERLIAAMPPADRPPSLMMALHIWTMSHGIASLFCRPDRARRPLPMSAEDLLEAEVLLYLRGLGLAKAALRQSG